MVHNTHQPCSCLPVSSCTLQLKLVLRLLRLCPCRHVELGGVVLPMSRGTTICWLATDGCVTRIRDFTEVPMALALQALSVASPALDAAVPLLPSLQGVLAVAGMLGQQPSTASSSNSSSTSGMGSMDAGSAAQAQAMPFFTLPSLPTLPFLGGWPQQDAGGDPGNSSGSSSGSSGAGSSGGGSNAPMVKAWDSGREIRMRTLNPPSASNGSSATKATSTSAGGRFATTASTSETAAYTVSTSAKSWGRDSAAQPTIRGGSTVVAAAPAAPVVEAAPVVMDLSGESLLHKCFASTCAKCTALPSIHSSMTGTTSTGDELASEPWQASAAQNACVCANCYLLICWSLLGPVARLLTWQACGARTWKPPTPLPMRSCWTCWA